MEAEYEKAIGWVYDYVRCRNIERGITSMEHCIKLGKYFMAEAEEALVPVAMAQRLWR